MIKRPRLGLEATLSTCFALSVERQLLGSELYGSYFGFGSGHAGHLPRFIAEKQSLKLSSPEAADRQ